MLFYSIFVLVCIYFSYQDILYGEIKRLHLYVVIIVALCVKAPFAAWESLGGAVLGMLPFLRQTGNRPTEFYTDALHGFIAAHLFLCAAVAVFAYMLIKIFNLLRKYLLEEGHYEECIRPCSNT